MIVLEVLMYVWVVVLIVVLVLIVVNGRTERKDRDDTWFAAAAPESHLPALATRDYMTALGRPLLPLCRIMSDTDTIVAVSNRPTCQALGYFSEAMVHADNVQMVVELEFPDAEPVMVIYEWRGGLLTATAYRSCPDHRYDLYTTGDPTKLQLNFVLDSYQHWKDLNERGDTDLASMLERWKLADMEVRGTTPQ